MEETLIKRVLPHSIEAEQSVIGSMLMDREAVIAASEIITGSDFYQMMKGSTNWHLGYGADLQVGYQLTSCLKLGIYSGLTRLTGERMDGMPEYQHKNNFLWESGIRLGINFPFTNPHP